MQTRKRRRRGAILLILVGVSLLFAGLAAWAFWLEPASLRVNEECVAVDWKLPRSLRVALLSDLHVGSPFNGIPKLREIVTLTNAQKPDLILILGDLVIQGVRGGHFVSPEDSARELGRLSARAGVFAVLGNHDVWLDGRRVAEALEHSHIPVLRDQAVKVETAAGPLWLAGLRDLWTEEHDIKATLAQVTDSDTPLIVMTHNPDVFVEIPNRVTLTVAGHTHGGQVRIPLLGSLVVPSRYGQRFAAGHIVEERRHLYVATGTGTSIWPVRFRVPPSISVLTVDATCGKGEH